MPEFFTNEDGTKGYAYWTTENWEKSFENGAISDFSDKVTADGFVATRLTLINDEFPKDGYDHGIYGEFWKDMKLANEEFEFPRRAAA